MAHVDDADGLRAVMRDANSLCSPATAMATVGSSRRLVNWVENARASASSRSATSRALPGQRLVEWERTTPSADRVTVSSSRSTTSPSLTSLPSLTRNFSYDAAGRMLHLLDVEFDHDRARRDTAPGHVDPYT